MAKINVPPSDITRGDVLKSRGRLTVRTIGDGVYVQKWPRRRGKPKSDLQKAWNDRFSCLARELKSPFPQMLDAAEGWAKGQTAVYAGPKPSTGWYYRDVLETAAYGKLIRYQGEPRVRTPTAGGRRVANFSIGASSFQLVPVDTVDWDNNGFLSTTVTPSRIKVLAPGLYFIEATVQLNTNNAGFFSCELQFNGTQIVAGMRVPKNGINTFACCSALQYFHAGEYISVGIFNSANVTNFTMPRVAIVAITPEAIIP